MAEKCEKCGLPVDENGVCVNCNTSKTEKTPSNEVWARPGSVSAQIKAETVKEEPKTETAPAENSVSTDKSDISIDDNAPKRAQSQIGTAEQRAAYFNAIAGVEEEEVDEQFYVSETSLFDVPFNDTKEHLGYNFPKFRQSISKKTKKKIRIGGILCASLALVTAGVIALSGQFNLNFGFFNTVAEVPVLYTDSKSILMTTSKGSISTDIYYSDRRTTISDEILDEEISRLRFSPDYKRMLTIEKFDSSVGIYTLYERETYSNSWREAGNNGVLIDNGICSNYSFMCNNDAIAYLKRVGDQNELCVYSFSIGAVKKVASGVTSFGILSDNKIMYVQEDSLFTLTYNSHTDFKSEIFKKNVNQVVTAYDYGHTDNENFMYVTKLDKTFVNSQNQEITYNSGELHMVKDGKDTCLDKEVTSIIMPDFEKGTAYYYKSTEFSFSVSDFIEDDCEKEDAAYVESTGYDNIDMMTTGVSDLMKYFRYNLRNMTYRNQKFSVLNFGVVRNVATDLWYSDGKKQTEIAKSVSEIIETDYDGGSLVYLSAASNIEKIKFSELEQPYVQSTYDVIGYCNDILYPSMTKKKFAVCIGTKKSELDASYVRQAEYTEDNKMLYFIDTDKELTETGILKMIDLTKFSGCATVVDEIKSFEVIGNSVYSYSPDSSLFCNGDKIGQKVSSHQSSNNGSEVVFLADYDAYVGTGTLKVISENNVKTISTGVHDFAVYNDEVLSYISDYNKAEKTGSLYLASGIKAGKPTASKAHNLIRY